MFLLSQKKMIDVIIMFLKQYCAETQSPNVESIVNDLSIMDWNKQSRTLSDWKAALKEAKAKLFHVEDNEFITEEVAFETMFLLLDIYYTRENSDDVGSLLGDLLHAEYGATSDPGAAYVWEQCIEKIKQ